MHLIYVMLCADTKDRAWSGSNGSLCHSLPPPFLSLSLSQMEVEVNVAPGPEDSAPGPAGPPARCIRAGCTNPPVDSKDWDREYCSNECVATHCRYVYTRTRSHMYARIHTRTQACTHTRTLAHGRSHTHTHTPTHARTRTLTLSHSHL